jgi:alpha-tubulin suppressor-like RCC1 family protein
MALNFPDNPTPGQQYTDPNNLIWEFNGVVWTPITGTVGISGFSGTSGYSGYSGTSGYSGINGISGFSGTGSAISASDEGNLLTNTVSSFNFVGTNVVATNVGGAVTLTIDPPIVYNNSVWAWGMNSNGGNPVGKLGDNTAVNKSSPVSVVGGFTDWCQISASKAANGFSLGVRTNGTLWAWGKNGNGTLGDNTTVCKSSPISVVGGFTDWCQVSAGSAHALGVRQNGTAWGWGYGGNGRLGDNCTSQKLSPVSVVGGFTDWCQVSAGKDYSLGLRTNSTLYAWGRNYCGKLGDNTTADKSSPVSVVGGFTDWCQVSGGYYHSLAVRQNGTAWGWGQGSNGKLGDNTTVDKSSPVSVVGGFTNWCQVAAGGYQSLGVRTNGTAWAWGVGSSGELGDNTIANKSSPVSVIGGFTNWCQVAAGTSRNSAAVRTNGTIWGWGSSFCGELGDNTTVSKSSPVSVIGGFTDWCQVAAGNHFSLAIRSTIT